MTKNAYIHAIEKAAVIANKADSAAAKAWQTPDHAQTHVGALCDLVRAVLTPAAYQFWLDSFGEYADLEKFEADELAAQEETERAQIAANDIIAMHKDHSAADVREYLATRTLPSDRATIRDMLDGHQGSNEPNAATVAIAWLDPSA